MAQYNFQDLKVVAAEPNSALREEMETGLRTLGFANIVAAGNMQMAREAFMEGDVRLFIGEADLPEGDLSGLIHQVRHQEIGDSPFVIVIALISGLEHAKAAIEAGADDVLLKPFKIEKFLERILALANARKDFVVTTGYIGPNRRQKPRVEGSSAPCIYVPNPLHVCFSGTGGGKALRRAAHSALSQINRQKAERHAYQVRWLAERIAPKLMEKNRAGGGDADDHMTRLYWTLRDLGKRVAAAGYGYAAYLIQTLSVMVDEIREFPDLAGEAEAKHMDKLSMLILRACSPGEAALPGVSVKANREEPVPAAA